MSAPTTLESIMRAYGDFHHMFRAMAIYETATGTLLDEEQKQRAVNGFLDAGAPRKAFFCLPGLGDSILLTAVARHVREATGLPCPAVSSHALLFRNSKDVSHVLLNYEALTQAPGLRIFCCNWIFSRHSQHTGRAVWPAPGAPWPPRAAI